MDDGKSRAELLGQATYYMLRIGCPSRQKGYRYLREAIWLAFQDPGKLTAVTKLLYPEVAKLFDTTSGQVERAMRNTIDTTWARGRTEAIQEIFGEFYVKEDTRPTNTEFIVALLKCIDGKRN